MLVKSTVDISGACIVKTRQLASVISFKVEDFSLAVCLLQFQLITCLNFDHIGCETWFWKEWSKGHEWEELDLLNNPVTLWNVNSWALHRSTKFQRHGRVHFKFLSHICQSILVYTTLSYSKEKENFLWQKQTKATSDYQASSAREHWKE